MAIKKFYKIIQPEHESLSRNDNSDLGSGLYGNYTWYHRLVQGSATRLVKYREYDIMDNDIDVARALDIIAEEMTGNNPKDKLPLKIKLIDEPDQNISSSTVVTLKSALRTWCKIQDWDKRLFELCRNTVKYGDTFFIRPKEKNKRIKYVHPKHVISAAVSENDITDVRGWFIKTDYLRVQNQGTNYNAGGFTATGGDSMDHNIEKFDVKEVVRFTLNDEMSEEAPFGTSILRPVYTTFKQKELLEDAVLIYRIQRAPERRVFYVDVGRMPAHKVAGHLNQIKNEIKQKKIPSAFGGKAQVESVYNPQSMSEDFFFAQRSDGSGSRVETLPGGQGLGELSDLEYFYKKMWRAMRIPNSYMSNTMDDGAIDNAGRVGIAYMQEIKFTLYIERLQTFIERVMDIEFKRFLHDMGISVDPTIYEVILPQPSDYSVSRDDEQFSKLLGTFLQADGSNIISKRFAMRKYLALSPDEIKENERLLAQEKGLDGNDDRGNLVKLYNPDDAELGGFEGGIGSGGSGGSSGGPDGGFGDSDDIGADDADGADADADGTDTDTPPTDAGNTPPTEKNT